MTAFEEKELTAMERLLAESTEPVAPGDLVEGEVFLITRNECLVNLGPHGTGWISGRELAEARFYSGIELEPGMKVTALIVEREDDSGNAILSLKRANKEKIWQSLKEAAERNEILTVKAFDANRGGMLIEYEGIRGFLPVSQLAPENYPRVQGGDREAILQRLKDLVGKPIQVRVLDADKKENKLIFSERAAYREAMEAKIKNFEPGTLVSGMVTGIVDFGIFMSLDGIEGMVHVSEIDWDHVLDPREHAQIGQTLKAQVVEIDGDRLSLSLKRLKPDPWLEEIKTLAEGAVVPGIITRITPFGAFVQLSDRLEGFLHTSEISEEGTAPAKVLELKQEYPLKVLSIDPKMRKIVLSLKQAKTDESAAPKKKAAKKSAEPKAAAKKTESKKATKATQKKAD